MCLIKLRVAGFLILTGFSAAALAEYSEKLSYSNYAVKPRRSQSLLDAIKEASPFQQADGRISHGHTDAKVSWSFDMRESRGAVCAITKVRVHLDALITLPELVSGNEAQQREFTPYIAALSRHEQGHYQLNQASAREIARSLSKMPKMSSCKTLQAEANRVGNLLMDTDEEVNADYDRRTQHGASQGAALSD